MITNGSRFAVVSSRHHTETVLAGAANSLYDPPYFARRAGSSPESVLVIGSAEGENVISALARGAKEVVAVDINPAVFRIMKHDVADWSGDYYNDPRVTSIASEGRRFLELTPRRFDVITLQGVQTGSTANLASTALLESFLFTEEAMAAAWRALTPTGVVFYDEYRRYRGEEKRDVTLIGILAGSATSALGLTDPARQVVFYSYTQGQGNPNGQGRVREGLLLYKKFRSTTSRSHGSARSSSTPARRSSPSPRSRRAPSSTTGPSSSRWSSRARSRACRSASRSSSQPRWCSSRGRGCAGRRPARRRSRSC